MTNEQLTQNVVDLVAYKAKAEEEHRMFESMLKRLQDNMNIFSKLVEDVHIMAINMQNMQKSLEETNKKLEETNQKVDALSSKEFLEYKENKKTIRQNIISKLTSSVTGAFIMGLIWLLTEYLTH